LLHFVLWIASEPQNLQRISAFSVLAAAAAAAATDHDAPELRLRHFVFCLEGALDSLFSVEKELEVLVFCEGWWLISVKKELDVSVAIFAIRKFLHFLCGFRGGSTPERSWAQ
jgi:hypothetical protein